jgi:hypothetical protein
VAELKNSHNLLSDVMRLFLSDQCGVDALRCTTGEFFVRIGGRLSAEQSARLKTILDYCDRVRFAGAKTSLEELKERVRLAIHFVESMNRQDETAAEVSRPLS